jgi:LDH2 family malate/lactate/ureidoglycolate dehydrogenase
VSAAAKRAPVPALTEFCRRALAAAGADEATTETATAAMLHGSVHGVDSHGVRLLDHYVRVLRGGRVNPRPAFRFVRSAGAVAVLDADHGHGALATYRAMERATEIAADLGVGAVAIRNSSHFGPAGAYALRGAEAGCIALATCNSDSFMRLHDGTARFHGTNPLALAAPVAGGPPWLLDMATSSITYNRVQLAKSLGLTLPEGVASSADGSDTRDPALVEMLAPLGGAFGFKGAGLAGAVELLSATLTGMQLSVEIPRMGGPDLATRRRMGAFVLALRPEAFVDRETYDDGMRRYLDALRRSPARPGARVMAPGDRERDEAARRHADGVPIDPATAEAFARLAAEHGLDLPYAASSEERPRGRTP